MAPTPPRLAKAADSSGVAALEFALVAPVIVLLALGIIDLGRAIDRSFELRSAAYAGAQTGLVDPLDDQAIREAVRATNDLQFADDEIVIERFCESGGTVVRESLPCDFNTFPQAASYLRIQTRKPYDFIFPWPFLDSESLTLTGTAELRVD